MSDNKPAAFGEIDSAANESRLFTNHRDDGSAVEKNWYERGRFRSLFREREKVYLISRSIDAGDFKASQDYVRWQNSDTKKASLVRVYLGLTSYKNIVADR